MTETEAMTLMPAPWRQYDGTRCIVDAERIRVADIVTRCGEERDAAAIARIVSAVNAHDALLAALEQIQASLSQMEEMELDGCTPSGADCGRLARQAEAAIARAKQEGKQP